MMNGNQVLTNPMKPTYFPKRNIQAANLIMFQEVEPEYLMDVKAIPQWEWQLSQNRLCIRFPYSFDALATASSQEFRPPSTLFSSRIRYLENNYLVLIPSLVIFASMFLLTWSAWSIM